MTQNGIVEGWHRCCLVCDDGAKRNATWQNAPFGINVLQLMDKSSFFYGTPDVTSMMKLADGGVILVVAWLAYVFLLRQVPAAPWTAYATLVLGSVLLVNLIFPALGAYRSGRGISLADKARPLTLGWLVVLAFLLTGLFVFKHSAVFSRQWLLVWWSGSWVGLLGLRVLQALFARMLRRRGWNHKRIVVMGAGRLGQELVSRLRQLPTAGFEVVGCWDDEATQHGQLFMNAVVVSAVPPDIGQYLRQHRVEEVWLALPLRAEKRIRTLSDALYQTPVNVRLALDVEGFGLIDHVPRLVLGLPMLDLTASPMLEGSNRLIKQLEDRILGWFILLLIAPLLAIIALGVKLSSPGPVFFRQERLGFNGQPFRIWKFRSMVVHKEAAQQVTQASRCDPRITRFGAFLRRTSLDELPQIFNVVRGNMSLIGPRPHAMAHNDYYKYKIDAYMQRHRVKPGITGWAQVNGYRGETDTLEKMERRVEYDFYYIRHWSVWFDLRILWLTVWRGFVHKNAY